MEHPRRAAVNVLPGEHEGCNYLAARILGYWFCNKCGFLVQHNRQYGKTVLLRLLEEEVNSQQAPPNSENNPPDRV